MIPHIYPRADHLPVADRGWCAADTLLANLTVHEMLLYTAEMRNKVSLSADAKRERVEAVLSALGLRPCRDVLVGDPLNRGISGAVLLLVTVTSPRRAWEQLPACLLSCGDGPPFAAGGQAKRVNIGLGLVARDTRLLFLDEPTSGLDSFTANEVGIPELLDVVGLNGHDAVSDMSECVVRADDAKTCIPMGMLLPAF